MARFLAIFALLVLPLAASKNTCSLVSLGPIYRLDGLTTKTATTNYAIYLSYHVKAYTAGQKDAQMLRDICGWLNINSMRAEKVSRDVIAMS